MSRVYYKATRPDGTDFYTGTVDYAAALETGKRVKVNTSTRIEYTCCTGDVLHASDVPTETLIGGSWPCRLFEVTGRPVAQKGHKYGFRSLAVVREVEAWRALGPQGRELARLVERVGSLTADETRDLYAAWGAAWDAAWDAARDAARDAAGCAAGRAAGRAAGYAAGYAAGALVARDLIGQHGFTVDHYRTLTGPLAKVIGPVHPDDVRDGLYAGGVS